jgi:hypothetical protein
LITSEIDTIVQLRAAIAAGTVAVDDGQLRDTGVISQTSSS